jgi:hypothetical protein
MEAAAEAAVEAAAMILYRHQAVKAAAVGKPS